MVHACCDGVHEDANVVAIAETASEGQERLAHQRVVVLANYLAEEMRRRALEN